MTLFGLSPLWFSVCLFVFGLFAGRFLNRCIVRIPQREKFWDAIRFIFAKETTPGIRPQHAWYSWIPIIGTIHSRGRSPYSGRRVLAREPWIEILNGLLFVALYWLEIPISGEFSQSCLSTRFSANLLQNNPDETLAFFQWRYLFHLVLIEAMVIATFIDIDLMIIPDAVTLPAMGVGIVGSFLLGKGWLVPVWFQDTAFLISLKQLLPSSLHPLLSGSDLPSWITLSPHWHGLAVSLAGFIIGGGLIWIIRIIGSQVLKQEAMGFGDVVLMAMVGTFLGWQATIIAFIMALLFSLPIALALIAYDAITKSDESRAIPYGPYLCLGSLATLLAFQSIWYQFDILFLLGPLLPILAIVMCILLFITLHLMQIVKRLLGFELYPNETQHGEWTSADHLFHYSGETIDPTQGEWPKQNWPGNDAGRGLAGNNRWKQGSQNNPQN